jgi:NAD(P)H-nitrite reductase large subunit
MNYVIIGNSAGAIGAVEGIRQIDKVGRITIVSNEWRHTYSRPLISYLLQGKVTEKQMLYRGESFYEDNGCRLVYATALEKKKKKKKVRLDDGENLKYGKLLIATGSSPLIPPFAGLETVENKFTFMNLDDAKRLGNAVVKKRVLIIGAGLIGLKCAEGILRTTKEVTIVDVADRILPAVLDNEGAKIVRERMESAGVKFKLSSKVERFEKNEAVLSDGEKISFDVLVIAAGVRPNIDLLKGLAAIERGIVIDEKSQTTCPDIYAAGDCTECVDVSSGKQKIMALLPNAYMQGECAGVNMAGGDMSFSKAIPLNAAGFFGLHIITAGTYEGQCYTMTAGKDYKKLFYKNNRLCGFILIGNVDKAGIYSSLIREGTPLDSIDFNLVCEYPGLMAFTRDIRAEKLGGVK